MAPGREERKPTRSRKGARSLLQVFNQGCPGTPQTVNSNEQIDSGMEPKRSFKSGLDTDCPPCVSANDLGG